MDSLSDLHSHPTTNLGRSETRAITALLKGSDWEAVSTAVVDLLAGGDPAQGVQQTRISCTRTLVGCSELRMELNLTSDMLEQSERQLWQAIATTETIGELRDALLSHLRLLYGEISEKREKKTHNVVALIQLYIRQHYAEDLTNAQIAASVFLTTTYVCLLFKQETGMTLNEYVIETRITQAKRLLSDPANKLYDVCYAVGYKDPGYFGKLFKKQTGMTPGEFRDGGL
jgi:two-component system response regulator YesN